MQNIATQEYTGYVSWKDGEVVDGAENASRVHGQRKELRKRFVPRELWSFIDLWIVEMDGEL